MSFPGAIHQEGYHHVLTVCVCLTKIPCTIKLYQFSGSREIPKQLHVEVLEQLQWSFPISPHQTADGFAVATSACSTGYPVTLIAHKPSGRLKNPWKLLFQELRGIVILHIIYIYIIYIQHRSLEERWQVGISFEPSCAALATASPPVFWKKHALAGHRGCGDLYRV